MAPEVETKVDPAQSGEAGVQSAPGLGKEQTGSPTGQQGDVAQSQSNNRPNLEEDPKWKGLLRENRRWKSELESTNKKLTEMQAYMDAFRQAQGQSHQSPQVDAQTLNGIKELFNLSLNHPEIKKQLLEGLGLSDLGQLREQITSLNDNWQGSQYDSEMGQVRDYVKGIGLDPDEVEEELREHIAEHPVFSKMSYYKGGVTAAFRDKYWGKAGEFRERAINKETIEKKEALKKGQVQSSSQAGGKPSGASPEEKFSEVLRNAGGVSGIDFTR